MLHSDMKSILFSLILLVVISCNTNKCEDIPTVFNSYKEVLSTIDNTSFNLEESANASSSSWISQANFYSCDKITGFFVLKKGSKTYVFSDVPALVWNRFKNAESLGKFYNSEIRNKYHLFLN